MPLPSSGLSARWNRSPYVIGVVNQNVRDVLRIIELVEVTIGPLPVDNITILIRDAFPAS